MRVLGIFAFALVIGGCSDQEERIEEVASALAERRVEEADRLVSAWLAQRPESPEALAWAARVALASDRTAEAVDLSRRALEAGYDRAALRDVEGIILVRTGRFDEAELVLREYLDRSDRPEPMAARALAEAGMGAFRFRVAEEGIARWRRDAPEESGPWVLEAQVAERVGDPPIRVANLYREALKRDPQSDSIRRSLADALSRASQHDEAATEYDAYLDRHPDDPEALASAGLNELARRNFEAAAERFSKALERSPENLEALRGMARLEEQSGRLEEALGYYERAAEVDPEDPAVAYQQSLLLARLGRDEEAERMRQRSDRLQAEALEIEELRNALVRQPNDVNLQYEAARWLIEHGHPDEGIRWTEKILEAQPGHQPTCQLLAEHYESTGQSDLANYYRWQAENPPHSP